MPPDTASGLVDCYATVCTPSRHAIAEEEVRRIEKAFDLLPEDYREVLSLACLAGFPHGDVAAEMKRSEPSVRKLLSRARARLAILHNRTRPARTVWHDRPRRFARIQLTGKLGSRRWSPVSVIPAGRRDLGSGRSDPSRLPGSGG